MFKWVLFGFVVNQLLPQHNETSKIDLILT